MTSPIQSLLTALIGVALSLSVLPAWADEAAPAPAAATVAAEASALPDVNADEYFDGKTPGTFGKDIATVLPHNKRVAVVGFRVIFVVQNTVHAQVRASYLPGRDTTAAHSTTVAKLQGVSPATFQALTDKAYAAFMAQLKAAGREVVPLEQIQPLFTKIDASKTSPEAPYHKEEGGMVFYAFAPTGMPLWWTHVDGNWGDVGMLSQSNYKAFTSFSKDIDAIAIAPRIVVDFARMESSGNHSGLVAREASTNAVLGMAVGDMWTLLARADEVRYGTLSKGDEGMIRMVKAVREDTPFAEMQVEDQEKTTKFMALLTGAAKSKVVKDAVSDDGRYSAAAGPVLVKATGVLARFFQQHPAP